MSEPLPSEAAGSAAGPWTTTGDAPLQSRLRPGAVLRGLSRVWRTAALYGKDHPVIERQVNDLLQIVAHLLADRPSLTIFIHEETFFVGQTMLLEESMQLSPLLNALKKQNVLALTISMGLEARELWCMVALLGMPADEVLRRGGAAAYLAQNRVHHVAVGSGRPTNVLPSTAFQVDPRDAYRAGLHVIDELYSQASRNTTLDLHKARIVVNSLADTFTRHRTDLMRAAIIKNYDQNTYHHSVNLCILSLFMASRLQLDRDTTAALGLAALLHDVGKVRIPREILNKTGELTADERMIMQRHTVYGAQLLCHLAGHSRLAMIVAFEHHANYDLSGYPSISAKERPHLLARIVQIIDSYDAATTSRRIYRRPMAPDEVMRFILKGAGSIYDPALVKAFVHELGVYPVGTLVVLDDGALAVVRRPGERDAARPVVGITDPRVNSPVILHELNLEDHQERRILRSVDRTDLGIDETTYMSLVS
ncbi:MAG: HD-GYP domain-containing protein [Armatimonadota bacterium]